MIVLMKDQREHLADENYFLLDKTQSIYKMRNIKNQCVDLFSSLIEVFGDLAVNSTLLVIENLLSIQRNEPEKIE